MAKLQSLILVAFAFGIGFTIAGCAQLGTAPLPAGSHSFGMPGLREAGAHPNAAPFAVLYNFKGGKDACCIRGDLIAVGSTLYGATGGFVSESTCNKNCGDIFSLSTTGSEQVLFRFGSGRTNGAYPLKLLQDNGALYGTTMRGGANEQGTVFRLTTSGTEQVLYSFKGGKDGAVPTSLLKINGTLFGTTSSGGSGTKCDGGCGTVFSVSMSGTERVIYSFKGGQDGAYPESLVAVAGALYGITSGGGGSVCSAYTGGCGTIFALSGGGSESVLHRFRGGKDGLSPVALTYLKGTLYGATYSGGSGSYCTHGCGTLFMATTAGNERVLHNFNVASGDAAYPTSLIVMNGALYGATEGGGSTGKGAIFAASASGTERVLHSFTGADGAAPEGPMTFVKGVRTLYGTTSQGGKGCNGYGCGTAFSVTP